MNGPLPSTRVFLSDLPSAPLDSKVRFLGCVRTYNISTGTLILEHDYPRRVKTSNGTTPVPPPLAILVDINAALETVTWEEVCVGAWINVVGYVRGIPASAPSITSTTTTPLTSTTTAAVKSGARQKGEGDDGVLNTVFVDAVMVFSAGAIALGEYERILHDWQEVEKRVEARLPE